MKTRIYFIIALCCNTFLGFSQESTLETFPKALKDIPYVFKGEMTGVEYYFGDSLGNRLPKGVFHLKNGEIGIAYSSATIKVCQVFKGGDKLKPGTIELVTSAPKHFRSSVNINEEGDTNVSFFYIPHAHNNYISPIIMEQDMYNGIFFCKKARYPGDSGFEFDNPFGVYVSEINRIGYSKWTETEPGKRRQGKHMAAWYDRKADTFHVFYTEHQVMQFLDKYTGLDTTAVNHCAHPKKEPEKKVYAPPPYPYEKSLENHNKWMERMRKQIDSIKKRRND